MIRLSLLVLIHHLFGLDWSVILYLKIQVPPCAGYRSKMNFKFEELDGSFVTIPLMNCIFLLLCNIQDIKAPKTIEPLHPSYGNIPFDTSSLTNSRATEIFEGCSI